MKLPTAPLSNNSAFNEFLYAAVGPDRNGMDLTVLSTFARRDLDPWKQAADLCALPPSAALEVMSAMLPVLPGACSPGERAILARRLMALLPHRIAPPGPVGTLMAHFPNAQDEHSRGAILLMAIVLMLLSQWVFLRAIETAPAADATPAAVTANVTAAAAPAPDDMPSPVGVK